MQALIRFLERPLILLSALIPCGHKKRLLTSFDVETRPPLPTSYRRSAASAGTPSSRAAARAEAAVGAVPAAPPGRRCVVTIRPRPLVISPRRAAFGRL